MKQFKDKLKGTGSVFRFTLQQYFKNKANIISLIIILLFSTLMLPISTLIGGAESKKEDFSSVSKVIVCNNTPYAFEASSFELALSEDSYWTNTEFASFNDILPEPGLYSLTEDEVQIFARASEDGIGYTIQVLTCDDFTVSEDDISSLESLAVELFTQARYNSLNISQEQLDILMANWRYSTDSVESYLKDDDMYSTQAMLQLAYSMILMMVCVLSVSYIVRSIIEEKASKLVETLLVSVQPLALIVGKVLASMAYVVLFIFAMLAGYALSYFVTGMFVEVNVNGMFMGISFDLLQFSPLTIIAFIVSLLLGYLTFSLIAGLTGSGCSSMEDAEGATLGSTFLIMFGYIFSSMSTAFDAAGAVYASCLIPFLSIFCAPVQYLLGNIGFGVLVLSWVFQTVIIVLLAILCSKIYRNLIMHRGNRITWKQMLVMFRQSTASQES